jgi:hypothetical protein
MVGVPVATTKLVSVPPVTSYWTCEIPMLLDATASTTVSPLTVPELEGRTMLVEGGALETVIVTGALVDTLFVVSVATLERKFLTRRSNYLPLKALAGHPCSRSPSGWE